MVIKTAAKKMNRHIKKSLKEAINFPQTEKYLVENMNNCTNVIHTQNGKKEIKRK